jgi:hypothetical protein
MGNPYPSKANQIDKSVRGELFTALYLRKEGFKGIKTKNTRQRGIDVEAIISMGLQATLPGGER